VRRDGDALLVSVTNVGDRPGKNVVQVYAERPESSVVRSRRWLVGHAVVRADAGETVTARIALPARRFAHWQDGWQTEPGEFTLRIGYSVADLPLSLGWEVAG
jgi:beta-glucosidase